MKARQVLMRVGVVCVLLSAGTALAGRAERAAQFFAEGEAKLASGSFQEALAAYTLAARTDSGNLMYRQQYALVRRVIKLRKALDHEANLEKWEASAQALRSFYYDHELYTEAILLDRRTYARFNNAHSAVLLAESLLEQNANAEAVALLEGLEGGSASMHARVLLGIALAREGQASEAKRLADDCQVPAGAGPGMIYDFARLHAQSGGRSAALGLLACSFESTPPSQLHAAKQHAKRCPDFASLATTADFAKVLETASKIKVSGCSGGTGCGKCPSRTSCGSSKGQKISSGKGDQ